jgi:predicted transcriptional regulator
MAQNNKTKRQQRGLASITLSIGVNRQLRRALEASAKLQERSSSHVARKAIEQYLRLQDAPPELREAIERFLGVQAVAA